MKSIQTIKLYTQYQREPVWRLLSANTAPVILGLLKVHLFDKEHTLPSSIFHDRVAQELEHLRAEGWEMPQTAQSYIARWLVEGYLERTFPKGANEEVYELSTATIQCIRFIENLGSKHQAATESRLAMVIQQLVQLAEQTNPDSKARITKLKKERLKIDAEIKALQSGSIRILSVERALELAREIIVLAAELANDFRRVRDNFQQLNRKLREQIMENDTRRGEILAELFAGVDLIAKSEEGRTFTAFWRLLTDPEQSMELEQASEQVLSRPFAKELTYGDRRFIAQLTRILLKQGGEVHEVLQYFARSLKHFVQSKEYQEQRRLTLLLRETQRIALSLKNQLRLTESIQELSLTSSRIRSVTQWKLYDPSLHHSVASMVKADVAIISLATIKELVANSEINFRLLKNHIYNLLQQHQQITIAAILQNYPAEQGLASIIGYIALGSRHGVIASHQEVVSWKSNDGVIRGAKIPCIYFFKERCHEFAIA